MSNVESKKSVKVILGSGIFPEPKPRIFKPVQEYFYKLYIYLVIILILVIFPVTFLILPLIMPQDISLNKLSSDVLILAFILGLVFSIVVKITRRAGESGNLRARIYSIILYVIIATPFLYVLFPLGSSTGRSMDFLITGTSVSILLTFLLFVPFAKLTQKYINYFEYQVHGHEIVVRKGIVNKTNKHVPFVNITHISIRTGLFDRFLGIGTIEIQTAGGVNTSTGPEEKIEGITVYREVAYYIIDQIKKINKVSFESPSDHPVSPEKSTSDLWIQFYNEIQDIKLLFKNS